MKMGDVSTKTGMPASTIRYYERVGLIERQRRVSGRREFDEGALFALEFVTLAQNAGFTIAQTKVLLEAQFGDPKRAGVWRTLATEKRAAIQNQIKELKQMETILTEMMSCRCESLVQCVEKGRARSPEKRNGEKRISAGRNIGN
jgi:MerR family copper efflux transcriptional regulator